MAQGGGQNAASTMYSIHDILGLIVAVASFVVVLVLPGVALGQITNVFAFRRLRTAWIYLAALVVGYAVLPVADSLLARFLGLWAALAFNLILAAYGLRIVLLKRAPRPGWLSLVMCAGCLVLLAAVWIDVDINEHLYPSLLMFDTVKHAATVRALVETGSAPPLDPFFLREEPAGYYYYYYVLSALAERLCGGLIDARAAVGGQVFWTGLALVGVCILVFKKAGLRKGRLNVPMLLALMGVAGLQIIPVVVAGLGSGLWLGQINWWADQVASWPNSLLWVPHHVASLIACWTGFLILADAVKRHQDHRSIGAVVLAAMAFASATGLSVWVTLAAVISVAIWIAVLAIDRRWRAVLTITAAGAAAALIALPDLIDMVQHRAFGSPPIVLTIRASPFSDSLLQEGAARYFARFLMLPINYLIEFGVLLVGSYLFWRRKELRPQRQQEVARLLTISALTGLVLASFFKSTIVNNDLGWRAVLFTQMAALLWTIAALSPVAGTDGLGLRHSLRHVPAVVVVAMLLGYAGVLYDLMALRAFQRLGLSGEGGLHRNPQVDREVRTAYEWLAANIDHRLVVQHNPNAVRAFGYGLYGKSLVAVSDRHNARLFGAGERDVAQRLDQLIPVYSTAMTAGEAWQRLGRSHVSAAFVTANDAIWGDKGSWIWMGPPLYASEHVRVVLVGGAPQ